MTARVGAIALFLLICPARAAAQPPNDPTDLDADGLPGVSEASPGASLEPEVYALQGTGSILVDRSHYETFNINGFMWFLISQGWTVTENHDYPITEEILAPYDVVIIPAPTNWLYSFSNEEVAAFGSYLAAGGGLWIFHEYNTNPEGINSLSTALGVTFQQDVVTDSTDNEGDPWAPRITDFTAHTITSGVGSYGYYGGCCLTIGAPAELTASADLDAFSTSCPTAPPVLGVHEVSGRAVFSGDNTPLYPAWYPERLRDEEELLLQNIINWLAGFPPTATQSESWGRIKANYR